MSEAIKDHEPQSSMEESSSNAQLRVNQYLLNEVAKIKQHSRRLENEVATLKSVVASQDADLEKAEQAAAKNAVRTGMTNVAELSQLLEHFSAVSNVNQNPPTPWTAEQWYNVLSSLGGKRSGAFQDLVASAREPYEVLARTELRPRESQRIEGVARMANVVLHVVNEDLKATRQIQDDADDRARVLTVCQESIQMLLSKLSDDKADEEEIRDVAFKAEGGALEDAKRRGKKRAKSSSSESVEQQGDQSMSK